MTDLPSGWVSTTLGEIAETMLGKMLDRRKDTGEHPRPYLRNVNVQWGRIDLDDVLTMDIPPGQEDVFKLEVGDLLMCEGGEIGRCAIWNHEGRYMAFQKALHRVRPYGGIDSRYIRYLFEHLSREGRLLTFATGSTIKHLPQEQLRRVPVPLPPLAEQRRIVAALEDHLSRLDVAIISLQKGREKVELFRSMIRERLSSGQVSTSSAWSESGEAFLSRLRVGLDRAVRVRSRSSEGNRENSSELPALPDGWIWGKLNDLQAPEAGAITDGPFGSNLKSSHYTGEGPRVVRLQNIGDGEFIDERAHISPEHFADLRKHEVISGDLLVASLGAELPRCCVMPELKELAIVKADCIRVRLHPEVRADYLNLVLRSPTSRRRTADRIHGVGRPRLGLAEIRQLDVPIPPPEIQDELVEWANVHMDQADRVDAAIISAVSRGRHMRQSIFREAFSGRLVPQDPMDEPASVLLEKIKSEHAAVPAPKRRTRRTGLKAAEPISEGHTRPEDGTSPIVNIPAPSPLKGTPVQETLL
ncbi:restriction endonuclease subunit S [Planomonospora sp. ID67723]|uniref:restriction endonuclease subunit S n=1 Tax=Planomonospora sp. ID67723 TaxID=2738134 RepID=UPI0018C3E206|nr:restriction endonuclease subunit S [Planomonospora sp. ID67723]MBG0832562.1 restriction endonuclease subunit S [Planomonospora sp. ID67723]